MISSNELPEFNNIEEFLIQFENQYTLNILFAVETGSRAQGTMVEDSDYDVKGFFVYKETEKYFSLDKIIKEYIKPHNHFKLNGREVVLDYQFLEIRKFFQQMSKCQTLTTYWIRSPTIYRNLIAEEINEVKQFNFLPLNDSLGRFYSILSMIKSDQNIRAKNYIHLIIFFSYFLEQFRFSELTYLNIFEEVDYLIFKCNQNNLNDELLLMEKLKIYLNKNMEFKKNDRFAVGVAIPEDIIQQMEQICKGQKMKQRKTLQEQVDKMKIILERIYRKKLFS